MKPSVANKSSTDARPAFRRTHRFLSAGRSQRFSHDIAYAVDGDQCERLVRTAPIDQMLLAVGSGQSLGDSGLNGGHALIVTRGMDKILHADRSTGLFQCQPGVTIGQLAKVSLGAPVGDRLFPHVIPGTDTVTIAGAIANDVHGKNHDQHGSFCHHVERLLLLRSTGEVVDCSRTTNAELFRATLGGLGLTGLILSAQIKLRPVDGPLIESQELRFESLEKAFALLAESVGSEYRFFWFDPLNNSGRGLFVRSRHIAGEEIEAEPASLAMRTIARLPLPSLLGGPATWRAWYAFMLSQLPSERRRILTYFDALAPLSKFKRWNRLMGRRGLLHFQSVVPEAHAEEILKGFLRDCRAADQPPCIASVKQFGSRRPAGMLSFPREGITSALDFCNRGDSTARLLARLEARVVDAGGAVYPGKDATMSPGGFVRMFPEWETFAEHVDPRFSSSFWRRVCRQ